MVSCPGRLLYNTSPAHWLYSLNTLPNFHAKENTVLSISFNFNTDIIYLSFYYVTPYVYSYRDTVAPA